MLTKTFTGDNAVISVVTSVDFNGDSVWTDFEVGITSFLTSSQMQLISSQTQNRIVRMPVRRSERSIQFNIEWPLQTAHSNTVNEFNYNGFRARNNFHNSLHKHQQYVVNSLNPAPMKFIYNNNSNGANPLITRNIKGKNYNGPTPVANTLQPITVYGWILTVNKEYDRFKNVYVDQYIMNILTPLADSPAYYVQKGSGIFIPQTNDVVDAGMDWTAITISGTSNGIDTSAIPG